MIKVLLKGIVFISLLLLSVLALSWLLGYRVNTTNSIPKGIYKISYSDSYKNNYIIFCPDNRKEFALGVKRGYINRGVCFSGYGNLMKKVLASSGDVVSINEEGVYVNNELLPYSKPLSKDGYKRKLKHFNLSNYILKKDEILTMTDQLSGSYDSRYYGLIKTNLVKGMITPIWVTNQKDIHYETIYRREAISWEGYSH